MVVDITVRSLVASDLISCHFFRLRGLKEHPEAFTSDHDEEAAKGPESLRPRLRGETEDGSFVLGVFDKVGQLVGRVGLERRARKKESHTALLYGMYVPAELAGKGIGKMLLRELLRRSRATAGLEKIELTVTSTNIPAMRLYESFGLQSFGSLAGAIRVDSRYYDKVHMVLGL